MLDTQTRSFYDDNLDDTLQSHTQEFNRLNRALENEQKQVKQKLDQLNLEDELDHAEQIYSGQIRVSHTIPTISDTHTMLSFHNNIIPSETTINNIDTNPYSFNHSNSTSNGYSTLKRQDMPPTFQQPANFCDSFTRLDSTEPYEYRSHTNSQNLIVQKLMSHENSFRSNKLSKSDQDLILEHNQLNLPNLSSLLDHPSVSVRKRAAAHIQHMSYKSKDVLEDAGAIGIIQKLVRNLTESECRMECIGAITNLTYDYLPNKIILRDYNGVQEIARCIPSIHNESLTTSAEFTNFSAYESVCNCLWNLSASHDSIGVQVITQTITTLYDYVILAFIRTHSQENQQFPLEKDPSVASVIAVLGIMKNVVAIASARKALRNRERLVDDILWFFTNGLKRSDPDGKLVENSACIIRNLVFNLENEVEHDPSYYRLKPKKEINSDVDVFCSLFTTQKEPYLEIDEHPEYSVQVPPLQESTTGWQLLPYSVKTFIQGLREIKNPITVEASLAVLQNLASGEWIWSCYARGLIYQQRAMGNICEFTVHEDPLIVASACGCLRNLSTNTQVTNLLGEFGLESIVEKHVVSCNEDLAFTDKLKLIAFINVLNLLVQLCRGSEANCKRIGSIPGALNGLVGLAGEKFIIREKNEELVAEEKQNFSTTIKKKSRFLLYMMWCAKTARKTYLKHGFKKSDFVWYTRDGSEIK